MSGELERRNAIHYGRSALETFGSRVSALAIMLVLFASAVVAQTVDEGPFAILSGSWSGTGTIALSSGTTERIRCKAEYRVITRTNVRLRISCASDSHKFELQSNVTTTGETLSGTWDELTRHVGGQIVGTVSGDHVQARAEGQTFTALFEMTTSNNRQSITIESPGSELTGISIALIRLK